MDIKLANSAGFCFGVKRAVDTVYNEIKNGQKVYTYGPIIHNDEVVNDLKEKGVEVIRNIEELNNITEGTIIIRSHGVSKDIYDIIKNKGLKLVDATCPYVLKIHKAVKRQLEEGREIVIIGNESHPEVQGIKGWCNNKATVIETINEANDYHVSEGAKLCIVSQTTFNYKKFKDLVEIISKKGYDILVINTICNATEERQTEARELASQSDAMIVIGGKHSSNTQKLYEICKKECEDTYYIQTLSDLDLELFKSFRSVGITAGASTPNNIIKEVQIACQK
ncbi:4-hydroxy-3-methylbut-2-enyl diphosphate reductase [Mobilisporobacter senegalensis]|uniref:4-hydroxy-3-methylbut-2-enyl diphosphate reductase n=1 Tax=Mobilisporobacter senegalensis TaxID=1329262 RepID=A0A3N1X6G1_9FIRM|nr:4-hydroxy-3-methylbut-2-enyl diphosphate reductase [Mobilisporobacter senegalensis]ROR22370.1 4-hydroxy-3-methylbut-2-enyl diphosphate reductase [Mobilisporobacter senegalensis]